MSAAAPIPETTFGVSSSKSLDADLRHLADLLSRRAAEASELRDLLSDKSFRPECLTLYLHDRCNLACTYCLRPAEAGVGGVSVETAATAARLVADGCRDKGLPFTAAFHGWGEPAADPRPLVELHDAVSAAAREAGLETNFYIATNGVLPRSTADLLVKLFDKIGLSCDGPPSIQNAQRPGAQGESTSEVVRRTAEIVRRSGKALSVRTTVTRRGVARLEEIVDYILRTLLPDEIHIEPAYRQARDPLVPDDAPIFLESFMAARRLAADAGVDLRFSGSRLGQVHGPYCNVFRDVLNILPDQTATACFACRGLPADAGYAIGRPERDRYIIDFERVGELRRRLSKRPERCRGCFNAYHCVGDCPDTCPMDDNQAPTPVGTFRCALHREYATALILEHADELARKIDGGHDRYAWKNLSDKGGDE